MSKKKGPTYTIEESPYGDTGAVYEGPKAFLQHLILQLKTFRPQHLKNPERLAYVDADIAGYQTMLNEFSDEQVSLFMKIKHDYRGTNKFKNNAEIVAFIKANPTKDEK